MRSIPAPDDGTGESWPVRALRILKLLLTVVLLAFAVWNAVTGTIPV